MSTQHLVSHTGAPIEESAVTEFQAGLRGETFQPGDAGYDEARKIYNAMIDKHPGLIVRCAGVADVIRAVRFARQQNVRVAAARQERRGHGGQRRWHLRLDPHPDGGEPG